MLDGFESAFGIGSGSVVGGKSGVGGRECDSGAGGVLLLFPLL